MYLSSLTTVQAVVGAGPVPSRCGSPLASNRLDDMTPVGYQGVINAGADGNEILISVKRPVSFVYFQEKA